MKLPWRMLRCRLRSFYLPSFFVGLFLLFLYLCHLHSPPDSHSAQDHNHIHDSLLQTNENREKIPETSRLFDPSGQNQNQPNLNFGPHRQVENDEILPKPYDPNIELETSIKEDLARIELISTYKNRSLKEFQPAYGGSPRTIILMANYHTGSTFFGELLSQHPGTFYHLEPFHPQANFTCPTDENRTNAVDIIHQMLKCNLSCFQSETREKSESKIFERTMRCESEPGVICGDEHFQEKMCSKLPIQTMKLIAVPFWRIAQLLEDKNLDMRMLYLIRDPRGTLRSRVKGSGDWRSMPYLCKQLIDDYHVATNISKLHPTRFMAVRFEDLSRDVWNVSKNIYENFLHLKFGPQVQHFLETHTKHKAYGSVKTIVRDTKSVPFAWIKDAKKSPADFQSLVLKVQDKCGEAMKAWGYRLAQNLEQLQDPQFDPVESHPIRYPDPDDDFHDH